MALFKEASTTHEGHAGPTAQPSNIPVQTNARSNRNNGLFGGLQAPLTSWSDAELFDDNNLDVYREIAGLLTQGDALKIMGAERRCRRVLGPRKVVANV